MTLSWWKCHDPVIVQVSSPRHGWSVITTSWWKCHHPVIVQVPSPCQGGSVITSSLLKVSSPHLCCKCHHPIFVGSVITLWCLGCNCEHLLLVSFIKTEELVLVRLFSLIFVINVMLHKWFLYQLLFPPFCIFQIKGPIRLPSSSSQSTPSPSI